MMGSKVEDDDFDNAKNDILMENDGEMGGAGEEGGAAGPANNIFPLARIKKIMKADKDVNLVSADAVNLISAAAELFLDSFVRKASDISQNEKRRTILYKDFASAVKQDVRYSFLQELIPETVNIQAALEAQRQHGMAQSFTPSHSPVLETDDHFESIKISAESSSMKSSKSDFFAKRSPGNVNFLLNHAGNNGGSEEVVDISDDTM